MNKRRLVLVSIIMLAVLMCSSAVAVYATSGATYSVITYPKGTICGDAQLGSWDAVQFVGDSSYQGFYSLFVVNYLALKGGNSGYVTSTGGSLTVYNHPGGTVMFHATYKWLFGKYNIKSGHMYLYDFRSQHIKVFLNHIKKSPDNEVLVGNYYNAHIPNEVLGCSVSDGLVTYTGGSS